MQAFLPDWWLDGARTVWYLTQSPLVEPWLLIRWVAQGLLVSGLVFLADLAAGSALLSLIRRRHPDALPPALRGAASFALGSGLNALILFWLGMAGRLTPAAPLAVTAALGLAGGVIVWRRRTGRRVFAFLRALPLPPGRSVTCCVLAVLFAIPALVHLADLATPVIEFDSTLYHMQAARTYRESGSLAYHGNIRYNAHAHSGVLLLLRHWSILGEDSLAKLQNLEYALMILLVLAYAARELGWRAGWIPAALFVASSPSLTWVSKVEYADLPLAAYTATGGALLFHYLRRRGQALLPGALVLGFAASTKLQGHVVAAAVAAGFLVALLLRRRRAGPVARAAVILGLAVVLCCGGWWLRSWASTGSPAYPFFMKNHPDVQRTLAGNALYGLGRDWRAALLLPWHMLVGPPHAFADPFIFGAAGFLLLAALLAAAPRLRVRPPAEVVFLALGIGGYLVFWFYSGQVMRYLVSVLPLAAILFLWLLVRARAPRRLPFLTVFILAVPALHSTLLTNTLSHRGVIPAVTREQRQQMLAAALPYYYAARELNSRAAAGDRTYVMFCEDARYYLKSPAGGDWLGDSTYNWLAQDTRSAADVTSKLKAAGFRWVLVSRDRARAGASLFRWRFEQSAYVRHDVALEGAEAVFSDRKFAVIRLW